ncbi:hypothetical protein [Hufsiella ginkgonis]|uniref:Uncharacterized protein n=1 Tax=Hufsiella ginkgonis TaxID=2695274 RepID=A0A7K1Y0U2_9SPHI|nr:hypothetical protein [Hufsiella ginkgonis]MXV16863.1 hypothetical protein [Hufsiella ginkgonis]
MDEFEILKTAIKARLEDNGYLITIEKAIDHGHQYRLSTGTIINAFNSGKITIQGTADRDANRLFGLKN